MKGESLNENFDTDATYLDEIRKIKREPAMQIISNDQTITSKIVQGSKYFHSQSLATQVKKGEKIVSIVLAINKVFDLMGDGIVDFCTENESLKK